MKNKDKKIFIVGCGLGALSAALVLSHHGYKVCVIEKNSHAGGKMNFYEDNGFKFDIGPHVITLPFIIKDLFEKVDEDIKKYIDLLRLDTINRYFFSDKKTIDLLSTNVNDLINEDSPQRIEKLSKKYFEHSISQLTKYKNISVFQRIKNIFLLSSLILYLPFNTIESKLQNLSKNVQDIFRLFSLYIGSDIKHTPSIYLMLYYIQKKFGVYYIQGGLYKLAETLEKLAKKNGCEFIYDSEVKEINYEDRKIVSINYLQNNKELTKKVDILISNADFAFTHKLIIGENTYINHKLQNEIKSYYSTPLSNSAFIILVGVNKKIPNLSHHNTIISSDLKSELEDIFINEKLPDDFTIGIDVASKNDSSISPDNNENLFIMINVPAKSTTAWEKIKTDLSEKIISKIENTIGESFRKDIIVKKILTPKDLEEMYSQPFGAIYGQSVWGFKGMMNRKSNKSKIFENLYFTGGSVRPGGGVPTVISSGMYTAKLISGE